MPLNKVSPRGNMYQFITDTWNTIKGACPHDCAYCYVKRWGKLNPVRLDEKELKTDLGEGKCIFVGSSCDMFAEGIPPEWVIRTLLHCGKYNNNQYFFQTKNPKNFMEYAVSIAVLNKFAFCTTLETNRWYPEIMGESPNPFQRSLAMSKYSGIKSYVTIEPIMDFDLDVFLHQIERCAPVQVNIGANTSKIKLPEPSAEKVLELINELQKFTVVHKKSNLKRLLKSPVSHDTGLTT
jgi:DNA repair photolyase